MRRLCGYLLLAVIVVYSLGIAVSIQGVRAASPDFSVSPSLINRHQSVAINVTVNQLPGGVTYTFNVTVTLPNSTVVFRIVSFQSDVTTGIGQSNSIFPKDFPSATTLLDGTYFVKVSEVSPLPTPVGIKSFSVSDTITLSILSPNSSSVFTRGSTVSVITHAVDVQGKDFQGLAVNFTTPSDANITMTNLLGTGIYSKQYTLSYSDPLQWALIVSASDAWGNYGSASANIGVQAAELALASIHMTDSSGASLTSTTVNQTIYVTFQALYPNGTAVTSGSANITLLAPNGIPMAILNATYSPTHNGFFTSAGYFIRPDQPAGRWTIIIYTGRLVDGAGNAGPASPVSTYFDVGSMPFIFSLGYLAPILLLGLGATGSVVVLTKKSHAGFEYFDHITGGGIPDGSLVMLYGESKTGKSLLLEEMLSRRLRDEKPCIYITYELTSDEILKNARDFKWDLDPYVESGRLTIIDNSDLMSSLDLSKTRMKLSSALTMTENRGLQLFIDSMDLLFEDLDYREVKVFLSRLTEEVRKLRGCVYFSLTTSTIIKETIPEIQDIIDWSIELQTRKKGTRLERFMVVKKLKDAAFKGANSRFKLVKRRGMVFDVPLIRKLGRS